jgi:hypothetical protein
MTVAVIDKNGDRERDLDELDMLIFLSTML